ncbi:glucokinase [Szabonella alba]|uniref:Glucokinase n=1 Tax=Szabonella alba TaxID=2804194 RepID=A0A8K0Y0E9_9RHOB|nr:glucokinase [Szabonella alba]MBL4917776.1 glucokinase [Szabonella alba]
MTATDPRPSLVADIGGTNTRVALATGGAIREETIRRFRNADHPGLAPILRTYLDGAGAGKCAGACIAVAGPVRDGVATMTNLDWTIDAKTLEQATGAPRVAILNDLQAQGHALGHIPPGKLTPILRSAALPAPGATKLVIGIGTGFNAAPVHETPQGRLVAPSECGHVTLPVRDAADLRLATFIAEIHGFPGVEDVLSGRGLERLFAFQGKETGQTGDQTAAGIAAALDGQGPFGPRAQATGRLFSRLLGNVAGDLALIHLPFGGIYLCGGVARAFAPHLAAMGFTEGFRDKGRFAGFMEDFSVAVIEDDYAALTGCAVHLAQAQ